MIKEMFEKIQEGIKENPDSGGYVCYNNYDNDEETPFEGNSLMVEFWSDRKDTAWDTLEKVVGWKTAKELENWKIVDTYNYYEKGWRDGIIIMPKKIKEINK